VLQGNILDKNIEFYFSTKHCRIKNLAIFILHFTNATADATADHCY